MTSAVKLLLLVCVILCAVPTSLTSNADISAEDLEILLDQFINDIIRCRKFSGINIAVVRGNDTLLTKGYGVVDLATNVSATKDTLFGIASLSKAFTSTLLGIVIEKSDTGYTWDTEVRTILGDDFYFVDALRTKRATLRDLLSHRMGFPSYNDIRHQSGLDRKMLVEKIRFLEPNLGFRDKYKYNNLMYGLLTHVTEVIGGDTWENLMKQHVFLPLGMTSSDFTHEIDLSRTDLAKSYQVDYDGSFREVSPQFHSYWGKIGGSGSIVSNAKDMSQWIKALINQNLNEAGDNILSSEVIKETHTPVVSVPIGSSDWAYLKPQCPVSYTQFQYGLAWRIGFYRGWPIVLHTGTSMGYLNQITLVPDLNLAVHTSLAGDDPGYTARRLIHLYTLDLLMGEAPWLNQSSACEFPQGGKYRSMRTRNKGNYKPNLDLSIYAGSYGNYAYGNVTFHVNETTQMLMMVYGDYGLWEMRSIEGEQHAFDGIGQDHVWVWTVRDVVFSCSDSSSPCDQVTLIGFEREMPPVYIRGLRMDSAPPPPELDCGVTSGFTQHSISGSYLSLLLLFSLLNI